MDTLAANERSPNFISCKREWHLPRMYRPDPLPGRVATMFFEELLIAFSLGDDRQDREAR